MKSAEEKKIAEANALLRLKKIETKIIDNYSTKNLQCK